MSWNGNLATGASACDRLQRHVHRHQHRADHFAINGVTCNGAQQPTQSLVVSPTAVTVPEGGSATYGVRSPRSPPAT